MRTWFTLLQVPCAGSIDLYQWDDRRTTWIAEWTPTVKCDCCDNDAALYSDSWAICGECPDTKPQTDERREQ